MPVGEEQVRGKACGHATINSGRVLDAGENLRATCGSRRCGGSPWRNSKPGKSFGVDPEKLRGCDAGTKFGGGPVQYLCRLMTGGTRGKPTDRELASRAGVELE